METLNTVKKMLKESMIYVPNYQRAYSWDSPCRDERNSQVAVFLDDILEHISSTTESEYYLGHFLFERDGENFKVIDGQQRLTTISILLSVLFDRLRSLSDHTLTGRAQMDFEDSIKRGEYLYRFSTVDYDNQFFRDYIIDRTRKDRDGLATTSAHRVADAYDYYCQRCAGYDKGITIALIRTILSSSCTTHSIGRESEAIQMFIFQNNRGKKPTNLEIVKAQFMYCAHLEGGEDASSIIKTIQGRFEAIYHVIAVFEGRVSEDEILLYTQRVYFNSLWEDNSLERIGKELDADSSLQFVCSFSQGLEQSFEKLKEFYGSGERDNIQVYSLVTLGGIGIVMPFIIKAYSFGLNEGQISDLCEALECLVLRNRLVGTRASLESRIRDVYESFTLKSPSIVPILEHIEFLKTTTDWWWAYWNNDALEAAIQGGMSHSVARFLLWKYENYLRSQGESGYSPQWYDKIVSPELEHIAPTTEPEVLPHGYGEYDEEFRQQYLNCLGNYLLLSKSHNCSLSNQPFAMKMERYGELAQQREVSGFTGETRIWDKNAIAKRKQKIVEFILKCM